jgi:hypothetical protein
MRDIEHTRAKLNRWTVYDGPGSPLVRRGVGHPDIDGWTRVEVVPAEQLREAVARIAELEAILAPDSPEAIASADAARVDETEWPDDDSGGQ